MRDCNYILDWSFLQNTRLAPVRSCDAASKLSYETKPGCNMYSEAWLSLLQPADPRSTALMPSHTTSGRCETAREQPLEDGLQVKRRHPGTSKLSQMLESNLFSQFPCYFLFLILPYVRSFIAYCISAPTLNTQPSCTEFMCPTSFMRHANDQGTVCHEIVSFVFHPAHVAIAMKLCYVIACSSHLT